MDDQTLAYRQCRSSHRHGQTIADRTARTIASWYHAPDGVTDAFTSTGIITDPQQLWDRLTHVSRTNRLSLYTAANERERFMLDCLAVYILTHGERGAVPGWSDKWVDKV